MKTSEACWDHRSEMFVIRARSGVENRDKSIYGTNWLDLRLRKVQWRWSHLSQVEVGYVEVEKWHIYGNDFKGGNTDGSHVLSFSSLLTVPVWLYCSLKLPIIATRSIITIMNSSPKKSIKHSHTPCGRTNTRHVFPSTWLEKAFLYLRFPLFEWPL